MKLKITEKGKSPIIIEILDKIDNDKSSFDYESYGIHPECNNKSRESGALATFLVYMLPAISASVSLAISLFVEHVKRMRRNDVENFWKNNKHFKIYNKNHIVTIKHINARALLRRLSEMYSQSEAGTTIINPDKQIIDVIFTNLTKPKVKLNINLLVSYFFCRFFFIFLSPYYYE